MTLAGASNTRPRSGLGIFTTVAPTIATASLGGELPHQGISLIPVQIQRTAPAPPDFLRRTVAAPLLKVNRTFRVIAPVARD